MPVRPLLARCGLALLVLLGAVLAAVGGIAIGGAGLLAVALSGAVAACLGAGIAREGDDPRRAPADTALRAAAGTVAGLLLISGCVVLAGSAVAVLAVVAVLGLLLARWGLRAARAARVDARTPATRTSLVGGDDGRWVHGLSVQELGREWVRSSAALAAARDPFTRQELVRRRQEALDELERRDPAGFARWLEGGATADSDPAEYVSGDPAAGSEAA
ncbi:hypothetical protein GCU67_11130 [Modestobacter muralis]|uniref:Uncharacterized protein n=1 Tax=Modestobacter muralis TaxID=1608614 RepID=A0A6P0H9V0_9ACTN|nr:hypothetical protein [Modestobacter muralis]NEK94718.1 hypothetical protein [Modestobacter muralis]NEN51606.1 hypothetical protein [Modestobacter muralis]